MQQVVTPDLGLLHVTRQGRCQWIAGDKRLCDQGVQHGDTVILLSTRTLASTPQLEPEHNVTANESFVIRPGRQPARPSANGGSVSIESNAATLDPKLVDGGDSCAQYEYGVCLEHGRGVLQNYEEALVSQAYTVFEVVDKNRLNPEYLMMWFRRSEFDRYARFKSEGSVREIFSWKELCNVELPIPSIESQRKIVEQYNQINQAIKIKEAINNNLEPIEIKTANSKFKEVA